MTPEEKQLRRGKVRRGRGQGRDDRRSPRGELWRSVLGYEGVYYASDCGRVCNAMGHIMRSRPTTRTGYPSLILRDRKNKKVHRLVAEAFLGPCPRGKQVNHKNGDKTDNRLDNLEYVTAKENTHHAMRVLNRQPLRGDQASWSLLNEDAVREIRRRYAAGGITHKTLAAEFGVTRTTILHAVNGRNWRHVQ